MLASNIINHTKPQTENSPFLSLFPYNSQRASNMCLLILNTNYPIMLKPFSTVESIWSNLDFLDKETEIHHHKGALTSGVTVQLAGWPGPGPMAGRLSPPCWPPWPPQVVWTR